MKTFILLCLMIDPQGNESLMRVSTVEYKDLFKCHVDKVQHKETDNIKFVCVNKALYKEVI